MMETNFDKEKILESLRVHAKSEHLNLCSECPLQNSEEEDEDGNYEGECTFLMANGALQIIENLQKKVEDLEERIAIMSEDGWHDAEKDQPKKSGMYFVFDENEDILKLEYDECIDDERWGFWEEYFDMETLGSMGSDWNPYPLKVLYWMIIPEPPKGEEA